MTGFKWGIEPFNATEWDALNDDWGEHPHLHSANVQLLLKHFGTGKERIWVCRRGAQAVAITVITGGWLAQNFHPSNQTVALWVQRADVDFGQLLQLLAKRFLMLSITHVDPDMLPPPPGQETVDYIETTRLTIGVSPQRLRFADYWASRRNIKDNDRKGHNKLAKAGIQARMEVVRDAGSIGAAVDDYGRLESTGWKGAQAVSPENAQGRYYRELFEAYAARGMSSVWRYFYGDRLVATDLCVHRGGMFIVLKTTYAEGEKSTSPSQLMRKEMCEQLFSDGGPRVIEFYGPTMQWHRSWSGESRIMYHVNAFRFGIVRSLRGWIRKVRAAGTAGKAATPSSPPARQPGLAPEDGSGGRI